MKTGRATLSPSDFLIRIERKARVQMADVGSRWQEERLHFLGAALGAASDGIVLVDPELRLKYANQAFCRLAGCGRAEEVVGRAATDFVSEDDWRQASRYAEQGPIQARPRVFPMRLRAQDGHMVPVDASVSLLRNSEGRPQAFLAIIRDGTERERVEATLRYDNALLETQREASIDGILVVDGAGRMISFNRRFVAMWGIPDEVVASGSDERALESVVGKLVDPQGFLERVHYLYQHPAEESRDEIALRDGRTFDRYSASVIGADGTYYGRVWYFRDITKRKQAEEALQRARDEAQAARARDVEIGARIQQALLLSPPPTAAADFQIAALAVPSWGIDGDFYEFLLHPNRCLDVIFGDVMGKGVPAALLAAGAKTEFLRSVAHLLAGSPRAQIPQPADIVNRVHQVLTPHLLSLDSFVTLLYVRFDPRAKKVTLVDCGSTNLIRRAADTGRIDYLSGFNLPLGAAASEVYAEASFEYAADDLFVLYSDGVTEARNPAGEVFGLERLRDLIARQSDLGSQRLADAISEAVTGFVGSDSLADDLTCVVLKALEVPVDDRRLLRDELAVPSHPKELRRIRAFLRGYCEERGGCGLTEQELDSLELAVSEAASNIMRHAYHGRSDRQIVIGIDTGGEALKVQLTHDGDPFVNGEQISDPLAEGAWESGFGLFIMRQAVDRVDYGEDKLGRQYIRLSKRVTSWEGNGHGV
jgi:sigma-B regulation protein RsbU (phosphoserine phosphatase)